MTSKTTPRHTVTITDAHHGVTNRHFRWIDAAETYVNQWSNLPGVHVSVSPYAAE